MPELLDQDGPARDVLQQLATATALAARTATSSTATRTQTAAASEETQKAVSKPGLASSPALSAWIIGASVAGTVAILGLIVGFAYFRRRQQQQRAINAGLGGEKFLKAFSNEQIHPTQATATMTEDRTHSQDTIRSASSLQMSALDAAMLKKMEGDRGASYYSHHQGSNGSIAVPESEHSDSSEEKGMKRERPDSLQVQVSGWQRSSLLADRGKRRNMNSSHPSSPVEPQLYMTLEVESPKLQNFQVIQMMDGIDLGECQATEVSSLPDLSQSREAQVQSRPLSF